MKSKLHSCACGCGESSTLHRMVYVRAQYTLNGHTKQGLHSFLVRRECQAPFERELAQAGVCETLVRQNIESGFFRRLAVVAQIYDLQVAIHQRADPDARGIARRAAAHFVAPRWMGKWLPKVRKEEE